MNVTTRNEFFKKNLLLSLSFYISSMNLPSDNLYGSKILPRFKGNVGEIMQQRYSCRVYQETPIVQGQALQLQKFAGSLKTGPLGSPIRFMLVMSTGKESDELKGLGTYGFIKKPAGFIIGVSGEDKYLEDFGYGWKPLSSLLPVWVWVPAGWEELLQEAVFQKRLVY